MTKLTHATLREVVARGINEQLWIGGDERDRRELGRCADGALAAIAATVDPDALRDAAATLQHRWQADPACEGDDPVAVFLRNLSEVLRP